MQRQDTPKPTRDVMARHKNKDSMVVYNSKKWKTLRDKMRAIMPVCPDPFGNHGDKVVASREIHHIIPIDKDEGFAFNEDNLIALCSACHRSADQLDDFDPVAQRGLMRKMRVRSLAESGMG
jgi:hypothetical protein